MGLPSSGLPWGSLPRPYSLSLTILSSLWILQPGFQSLPFPCSSNTDASPCGQKLFNLAEVSSKSLFNGSLIGFQAWWFQPGHLCRMYLLLCGWTDLPINLLGHGEPLCEVALWCGLYGQLFVQGENRSPFHSLCIFGGLKQRDGMWAQMKCDESHLQLLQGFSFSFFSSIGAWFVMAQGWSCTTGDADISINETLKDKITNEFHSMNTFWVLVYGRLFSMCWEHKIWYTMYWLYGSDTHQALF